MHCFFFNDTATTEIYTLSLHDALPILDKLSCVEVSCTRTNSLLPGQPEPPYTPENSLSKSSTLCIEEDRKSTRLNSSHANISYAVFCLKKKKYRQITIQYSSHTYILLS